MTEDHFRLDTVEKTTHLHLDNQALKEIDPFRNFYFQEYKHFKGSWTERDATEGQLVFLANKFLRWLLPEFFDQIEDCNIDVDNNGRIFIYLFQGYKNGKLDFCLRMELTDKPDLLIFSSDAQFSMIGCINPAVYQILDTIFKNQNPPPLQLVLEKQLILTNYAGKVTVLPFTQVPLFLKNLAYLLEKLDPELLKHLKKLYDRIDTNPNQELTKKFQQEVEKAITLL
jgi:hypothetical protein